jgi:hypothetical protein
MPCSRNVQVVHVKRAVLQLRLSLAAASLPVMPGSSVTVCGAGGSGIQLALDAKPAATKQKSEQKFVDVWENGTFGSTAVGCD